MSGPSSSPSALSGNGSPVTVTSRPCSDQDVVALDVLTLAQRDGEAQPRERSGRGRDDDVEQAVVRLGAGSELRAAADGAAVGHRHHQRLAVDVHDRPVEHDPQVPARRAGAGRDAAHGVRRLAEPVLESRGLLGGLCADAEVHGVDDDTAGVVDDQVQPPRPAGHQGPGRVGRVERDAQGPCQVVAGPQRHQAQRPVGRQLAARVQGRHRGVHRPVAAHDDEHPVAEVVEQPVQVAGLGAHLPAYVGRCPQHAPARPRPARRPSHLLPRS